ncbi:methyltransferase [Nocardiopsis mangrovi]|uniref:Methyltransferase n=1 Tax=Nocardiopsis mangrovi TaxID=1179818 RepID=A0ABV9E6A2_9ACTN
MQGQALIEMAGILRPAAIRAAATLGVADHIAAGTTSAAELAAAVGADPDALLRLLRYLAAAGLFDRAGDDTFTLTGLGEPLRRDVPGSVAAFLDSDGVIGRAELGMVDLLDTLRTGRSSHASVFGVDFWTDVQHDPRYAPSLEFVLGDGIAWDADIVVDAYPWERVRHVTDVGGGNGALLIELLRAHAHLRGRLVDLPNSVSIARGRIAAAGLADRCEAAVASFFDELPGGSDVYVLSAVLADWTDEQAAAILRRVADAAGPQGRVLLAEVSLHPVGGAAADLASTGADLHVAATVTAPVRGADEVKAIAAAAGLRPTWEGPATAARSLIEFAVRP